MEKTRNLEIQLKKNQERKQKDLAEKERLTRERTAEESKNRTKFSMLRKERETKIKMMHESRLNQN